MTRVPPYQRRLSVALLIGSPVLLLLGDVLQVVGGFDFEWTLALWGCFLLLIPALLWLPRLLGREDHGGIVTGSLLAYVGALFGATMQAMFRTGFVLRDFGHEDAIADIASHLPLRATTQFPGILFPLGLLVLSVALFRSRAVPRPLALLLALGAILFPIGHAVRITFALIAGDVVLVAAFGWLAAVLSSSTRAVTPAAAQGGGVVVG